MSPECREGAKICLGRIREALGMYEVAERRWLMSSDADRCSSPSIIETSSLVPQEDQNLVLAMICFSH